MCYGAAELGKAVASSTSNARLDFYKERDASECNLLLANHGLGRGQIVEAVIGPDHDDVVAGRIILH